MFWKKKSQQENLMLGLDLNMFLIDSGLAHDLVLSCLGLDLTWSYPVKVLVYSWSQPFKVLVPIRSSFGFAETNTRLTQSHNVCAALYVGKVYLALACWHKELKSFERGGSCMDLLTWPFSLIILDIALLNWAFKQSENDTWFACVWVLAFR